MSKKLFFSLFSILLTFTQFSWAEPEYKLRIFGSKSCGWCKVLDEALAAVDSSDKIEFTHKGKEVTIPIEKVDVDDLSEPELRKLGYDFQGTPTAVVLVNDHIVDTISGVQTKNSARNTGRNYKNNVLSKIRFLSTLTGLKDYSEVAFKGGQEASIHIIGSSSGWQDNPVAIGEQIVDIKSLIKENYYLDDENIFTFYGDGNNKDCLICPGGFTAEAMKKGFMGIEHRHRVQGVNPTASFTIQSVARSFSQATQADVKKRLVVSLGQSGQGGYLTSQARSAFFNNQRWNAIEALNEGTTVMLNGNCYGGAFANNVSCGFFASRGDRLTSTCSPEQGNSASPYIETILKTLAGTIADANEDGKVSFAEAHAHVAYISDHDDIPYSSQDALIEKSFADVYKGPSEVPVAQLKADAESLLSMRELRVFKQLTMKLRASKIPVYSKSESATIDGVNINLFLDPEGTRMDLDMDSVMNRAIELYDMDSIEALLAGAEGIDVVMVSWLPELGEVSSLNELEQIARRPGHMNRIYDIYEKGPSEALFLISMDGGRTLKPLITVTDNEPIKSALALDMYIQAGGDKHVNRRATYVAQMARLVIWRKLVAEGALSQFPEIEQRQNEISQCANQSLSEFIGNTSN